MCLVGLYFYRTLALSVGLLALSKVSLTQFYSNVHLPVSV